MILFGIFLFILGAVVGSFLNVVVLRTKYGGGIARGRSRCPKCHEQLRPIELVPIFSFIFLGGKCRHCRAKISWQYLLVEISTAVLYSVSGIIWFVGGFGILSLLASLVFISFLIIIFVYDLRWQIVPDRFSMSAIIIMFVLNLFLGFSVWNMAIGAIIAGGFFFLQFAVSRGRWIGGGDIRLGILIGVALGWEKTLLVLLLAYVGGAIIGVILILFKQKKFESEIAFGTFLSVASLFALFWGDKLIGWYF